MNAGASGLIDIFRMRCSPFAPARHAGEGGMLQPGALSLDPGVIERPCITSTDSRAFRSLLGVLATTCSDQSCQAPGSPAPCDVGSMQTPAGLVSMAPNDLTMSGFPNTSIDTRSVATPVAPNGDEDSAGGFVASGFHARRMVPASPASRSVATPVAPNDHLAARSQVVEVGVRRDGSHDATERGFTPVRQSVIPGIASGMETGRYTGTPSQRIDVPVPAADSSSGMETRRYTGTFMGDTGHRGAADNVDIVWVKGKASNPLLADRVSPASGYPIAEGGNPGQVLDIQVEEVFASVMERIRMTDMERGRARFEIETDSGQTIKVRLTVDGNLVSARIDAPSEQVRDLLAAHARQLNHRLETEGLIPNDIEFCLAGGREQSAGQEPRANVHHGLIDSAFERGIEDLTMVESEVCAFESWA